MGNPRRIVCSGAYSFSKSLIKAPPLETTFRRGPGLIVSLMTGYGGTDQTI
jgi:hypothetical protein